MRTNAGIWVVLCSCLLLEARLGAAIIGGPITNQANGHVYYLLAQSTWTAAEAEAVTLGGHLATINDAAENEWVVSTFSNLGGQLRSLWIGLNDRPQESAFTWSDSGASTFRAWETGQPDNGGGSNAGEDCVHIWPRGGTRNPGFWNDYTDNGFVFDGITVYSIHGVVEIAPAVEPAGPLDHWEWRNPLPQGNDLDAVAFGNGTFVAVGHGGSIVTSSDGTNWVDRSMRAPLQLGAVVFGNNRFVALDSAGRIFTSIDGIQWSAQALVAADGARHYFNCLAYGNGVFVAAEGYGGDDGGRIFTSPDGLAWSPAMLPTSLGLFRSTGFSSVAYGNGRFVATGFDFGVQRGRILSSADGLTWRAAQPTNDFGLYYSVAHGNGTFVAVGQWPNYVTSEDGVSWTFRMLPGYFLLRAVAYGDGRFVALGAGGNALTSADGTLWITNSLNTLERPSRMAFGNGLFAAVGDYGNIATSSDGSSWTKRSAATSNNLRGTAYGNGHFVAVGNRGTNLTSPDGVTWTPGLLATTNNLHEVAFGDGQFVAVGKRGTILLSTDGAAWSNINPGPVADLYGVTHGGGAFVAVGYFGTTLRSEDGTHWTTNTAGRRSPLSSRRLHGVAYGNATFVAVGVDDEGSGLQGGSIVTSTDGSAWTQRYSELPSYLGYLKSVAYGNSLFVAVGEHSILASPDSVTWSRVFSPDLTLDEVTFVSGRFVAVGDCGTILSSKNGTNWTWHASPTDTNLRGVTFGRETFVAVGNNDIILQSAIFPASPLSVAIHGRGTVTPDLNGQSLFLGDSHTLTARPADGFAFVNWTGGITSNLPVMTFVMQSNLVLEARFVDAAPPVITISPPAHDAPVTEATITVQGTARDNDGVAQVLFQIDDGPFLPATGTTNWSSVAMVHPGINSFHVKAIDLTGNESELVGSRVFFLASPLTLMTNGAGTVRPLTNGQPLVLGKRYVLNATPRPGNLFSHWSGTFSSASPTLTFVAVPDTTLTAHFVTNLFPESKGHYTGLLYDPLSPAHENGGWFAFNLAAGGAFSGRLTLAGQSFPLSGRFDVDLHAHRTIARRPPHPSIEIDLQLGPGSDFVSGTVSAGAVAGELVGYRAPFSGASRPTAFTGRYTMLLSGSEDPAAAPFGQGFATLTVAANGRVALAGALADNTPMAQSGPLSARGVFPFYSPLYRGGGSCFGWVSLLETPTNDIHGRLLWTKPAGLRGRFYRPGFVQEASLLGSRYSATNRPLLNLTNAVVVLEGGNLRMPANHDALLDVAGPITIMPPNPHKLALTLAPANGRFHGHFTPLDTDTIRLLKGVLLQNQNFGAGHFLGTNQGGSVYFGPPVN